jgi:hypothetical protein
MLLLSGFITIVGLITIWVMPFVVFGDSIIPKPEPITPPSTQERSGTLLV